MQRETGDKRACVRRVFACVGSRDCESAGAEAAGGTHVRDARLRLHLLAREKRGES